MPITIESLTITGYASDGTVVFTATTLGPLTLEQFKKGQGANSDYALGLDAEAAERLRAALAADPNLRLGLEAMLSGVNGGPERFKWSANDRPVPEPATMVLLGRVWRELPARCVANAKLPRQRRLKLTLTWSEV